MTVQFLTWALRIKLLMRIPSVPLKRLVNIEGLDKDF